MARYMKDQNKTSLFFESGTYASVSGAAQWIGMVQDFEPDENVNVNSVRYQNTASRNVSQFVDGLRDFTATLTYYPQDWRMLGFCLGSTVDTSGTNSSHTLNEANGANGFTSGTMNPFISFSLEHAQVAPGTGLNFIRTLNGCVINQLDIKWNEGDPVEITADLLAQNCVFSSGAASSPSDPAVRPALWSDFKLHVPSGTILDNVKTATLTIKNGFDSADAHYLNGSMTIGVPVPKNRDYSVVLEMDGTSERTKAFYDQYFLGGSTFNMIIQNNMSTSAGSRDLVLTLSGCKVSDMEAPGAANDGVNLQSVTIIPRVVNGVAVENTAALVKYNAW